VSAPKRLVLAYRSDPSMRAACRSAAVSLSDGSDFRPCYDLLARQLTEIEDSIDPTEIVLTEGKRSVLRLLQAMKWLHENIETDIDGEIIDEETI
jgi:hypothetical protein